MPRLAAIDLGTNSVRLLVAEARGARPVLEPGRAHTLVPGIAICLAAMTRLGFDALVVSDRGLPEGILCEMRERA